MHARSIFAAVVLSSALAFAQGEGASETPAETPQEQPPADQVPVEKAAPRVPAVKLDPERDKEMVAELARNYFTAILLGEPRSLIELSALPFFLEDKKLDSEDEFIQGWQKALRKNTTALTLYGIEVLNAAEMEKKYGKPPARLATFPWKKQATYMAVGNVSGRAAVVIFLKTPDENFAAIGYHD